MGSSLSLPIMYDTQLYKWSSNKEFCEECALTYTAKGHSYPSRSCTFYYKVTPDKVIITMDDGLCAENRVKVNMEIVAVRDDQNKRFKFGAIKYKDSGTRYKERRRSNTDHEVLYLMYEDSSRLRMDLLGLCKRTVFQEMEYEVYFGTGFGIDDRYEHDMKIHCDPSKGMYVKFTGPYRRRSSGEEESFGTEYISGTPPGDVMDNVDDIRNELKIRDSNSVGAPGSRDHYRPLQNIYNLGNFVYNEGNSAGHGNGCINNVDDSNQHGRPQTNVKHNR